MRCSALLLAGGKSSRMGRDKALLEIDGQPLWQRQIATLRALAPEQLLLSGPPRADWNGYDVLPDEMTDAGPLAGIAAALEKCLSCHLVVLAVDLPYMTRNFLESLLALCLDGRGAVPRGGRGYEPLAAVYPISCAPLAGEALRQRDFSLQNFVRKGIAARMLVERSVSAAEISLFTNLNTPADL